MERCHAGNWPRRPRQFRDLPRKPWLGSDPIVSPMAMLGSDPAVAPVDVALDLAGAPGAGRQAHNTRGASRARSSLRRLCTGAGRTTRSRRRSRTPPPRGVPASRRRGARRGSIEAFDSRPRTSSVRRRRSRSNAPAPRCPARAPASGRASPPRPRRSARRRRRRSGRRGTERPTSTTPARGAARRRRPQVEESPEWGGHEAHALGHRQVAKIAEAEVYKVLDVGRLRSSPADVQHRRRSTPMTGTPARATATAMRPVPTPRLDDGAPRFACFGDVEVDVLGDGPAPGS